MDIQQTSFPKRQQTPAQVLLFFMDYESDSLPCNFKKVPADYESLVTATVSPLVASDLQSNGCEMGEKNQKKVYANRCVREVYKGGLPNSFKNSMLQHELAAGSTTKP